MVFGIFDHLGIFGYFYLVVAQMWHSKSLFIAILHVLKFVIKNEPVCRSYWQNTPISIVDDNLTFYHWFIYMIPCRSSVFMGGANTNLEQDKTN